MQDFRQLCKFSDEIKLNLIHKDKKLKLQDILPDNFCLLAFHSVYPYMLTLFEGGWFNWVGYSEHVIVNCPYNKGIAVYVKAPSVDSSEIVELEVIKKSDVCYKGYELKYSISFNFDKENRLKLKLLDSALPFIFKKNKDKNEANEFFCTFDGEDIYYHMEVEELNGD